MLPRDQVVGRIEVCHQTAVKVLPQNPQRHLVPPARIMLKVTYRSGLLAGEGPSIPVPSVLPPPRLIAMHHRAVSHSLFERISLRLQLPPYVVRQFHDLSTAQPQAVHRFQIRLDLAHW